MRPPPQAAFLLALWGLAACHALDRDRYYALLDARSLDAVAADARADGGSDAAPACTAFLPDASAASACNPVRPPARPSALRDVPSQGARVYVLREVRFGFDAAHATEWRTQGFDLDGYCTDPTSSPSQGCRPVAMRASPDGERGRDNAFASTLAPALSLLMHDLTEQALNDNITEGSGSVAVRVTDLGGPEDAHVTVEWLVVMDGASSTGGALRWDGNDTWHADRRLAFDLTGAALLRSDSAFVSCGTLVAPLPARQPFRFRSRNFDLFLTLSAGTLAGPVAPDGSLSYLDFTGVWPVSDALRDITTVGICASNPLFRDIMTALNSTSDVRFDGTTVVDTPDQPCNAMSVGFRATLAPARLAEDRTSAGADGGCM